MGSVRVVMMLALVFGASVLLSGCVRKKQKRWFRPTERSLEILIAKKHGISRNRVTNQQVLSAIIRIGRTQSHLFDGMPLPPIGLREDLESDGIYTSPANEIYLQTDVARKMDILRVYQILIHEMTHAWIVYRKLGEKCREQDGGQAAHGGHCRLFLEKACSLGLDESQTARHHGGLMIVYEELEKKGKCRRKVPYQFRPGDDPQRQIREMNEELRTMKFGEPLENWPDFPKNYMDLL